jgi:hypothetical protein
VVEVYCINGFPFLGMYTNQPKRARLTVAPATSQGNTFLLLILGGVFSLSGFLFTLHV